MTNPCPRCGTPRLGDYPICQRCGLDFRMAGAPAMPPQQLPPQQPLYGAPQQPLGYLPPAPQQPPAYQQPFGYPAQPPAQQSPFGYQQPYPGSSVTGQAPAQQSQDFQPAPPPPDTAPSVCLRCYTPLQPGSWHCGNCGFDNRTAWITPNLTVPQRRSMLPIALALLGVALLVVAVALVAVARSSNDSATPTASPTAVTSASPAAHLATATPKIAVPSAAKPARATSGPTPASSADPLASAALAVGTAEPAPAGTWTKFSAPDGSWSASFPGSSGPLSTSEPVGTGSYAGDATVYMSLDGFNAEYVVCYMDFPSALTAGQDSGALLGLLEASMNTSFGGTELSSNATTVGIHPARDVTMTMDSPADIVNYRMWFVSSRFYMMFTISSPGQSVYPQHFFNSFTFA